MTRVITDEQHYYDIADAIRGKLGVETLYLPSEMADAIEGIQTGTSLTSEDEGKVVVEDDGEYVLAAQTSLNVSQNGTYDTTTNDEVVVSVSGGGGGGIYDVVPEENYALNFTPTSNASQSKSGGTAFSSLKDIIVSKIRVFPRTTAVNVYITQGSEIVASVMNAQVTAEQWNDVVLDSPVTLEKNTYYLVWYSHVDGTALKYKSGSISPSISYITNHGSKYSSSKDTLPQSNDSSATYGVDLYVDGYLDVREAVLTPKTITQNGTYDPADDSADGYSQVTVNVSGGGGGITTISRSDWDALTTAQKRSYGFVGIADYTTGFTRGILVYGADYDDRNIYLPDSNERLVECLANYGNFESGETSWGVGDSPVTATTALTRYQSEDAVYIDALTNHRDAHVQLDSATADFTVYVVAKAVSYASGDVIVMGSVGAWSNGRLVMLYHRSDTTWKSSIYGSDDDLIDTQGGYVAVAIRSSALKASWFANDGSKRTNVSYTTHGTDFTLGYRGTTFSTDLAVKFVGYVSEAETDEQIEANLANLASIYGLS